MKDEIIEVGVVEKDGEHEVMVRVHRPDACHHCAAKNACETFGGKKDHLARAKNLCEARQGDEVKIRIPASGLLLSAFIVYFLPAAAMLVGAILGKSFLHLGTLSSDLASIIGGFSLFAITLLLVGIFSYRRRNNVLPEAFEIISHGQVGTPCLAPKGCGGE
ncbi:SoxR reducing system RseC family protein [Myxococcota bacterium]|nr:SoxR reducing system RseC family protein [Myxococcota bacterium]